jgi:predicted nucleic acid-binding OB-fold protein
MIALTVALIVLTILVGVLGRLVSSQEKRHRNFINQVEGILERLSTLEYNGKVLAQNDVILLKDMKMMLHEFKSIEKKVKHPRRQQS